MKTQNIAFGQEIVEAITKEQWKKVVELINNNKGDIIGFNQKTDSIQELLEHAISSGAYTLVYKKDLKKINKLISQKNEKQ